MSNTDSEIAAAVAATHARTVREQGGANLALVATSSNLTDGEIKSLAKGMVNFLRASFGPEMMERLVKPELALLERRIGVLERHIAELEGRPLLEDAGVWNADTVYHPGHVVTHDGSAWVCRETHSCIKPGDGNYWRLAVKRGRDAKGSR